jgi:cation:H+ antiporter
LIVKLGLAAAVAAAAGGAVFTGAAVGALWTFPAVLMASVLIAWGAESAQFLISQGLALAILAWMQTLPEFAVEAVIAWEAGKDPSKISLMTANFTGSLRILTGLGWPMIYATATFFHRKKKGGPIDGLVLEEEHAVEVGFLVPPILYFLIIWWKGSLDWYDSVVLTVIYAVYLVILNKIPPQEEEKIEDMEAIPKYILTRSRRLRNIIIWGLFVGGGLTLYLVAHPFFLAMQALALGMGLSTFVFVQWVSPFLSEFPEKVSAFYWARKVDTASMALMNMVSSNINQWTMLVAMLPITYALSRGGFASIPFDAHQRLEVLLTIAQALCGMLLLANMRFVWWEALVLFVLWVAQFLFSGLEPSPGLPLEQNSLLRWLAAMGGGMPLERVAQAATLSKQIITGLYFFWAGVAAVRVMRTPRNVFTVLPGLLRKAFSAG